MRSAMNNRVLVLNKLWAAVGVASMQRAITLLYGEHSTGKPKAQIVTPPPIGAYETFSWEDWAKLRPTEGENTLIAPHQIFKVPEVIVLTQYDKSPEHKVHFSRKHIWKRDNFKCQYCGVRPPNDELTLDHVDPKSLGGDTSWTNCVLACYQCNSQKANRRPEDAHKHCLPKEQRHNWRGPSPMRLACKPAKPKFSLFKGDRVHIPETWRHWVSKLYWEVPLVNDMLEPTDNFDDV